MYTRGVCTAPPALLLLVVVVSLSQLFLPLLATSPSSTCTVLPCVSPRSSCRFRVDHFKGYPAAAVAAVREDNTRVHAERLAVTAAAAEVRAAEDAATLERARAAAAVEATIAADRRERAHAYSAELRAAADARREVDAERRAEERARQFPTASGLLAGFGRSLK